MALNKATLGADLLAMMKNAEAKSWAPEQVADAMAAAIDSYVRGGDVNGVRAVLPNGQVAVQSSAVHPS
jgi:hypothetical protein